MCVCVLFSMCVCRHERPSCAHGANPATPSLDSLQRTTARPLTGTGVTLWRPKDPTEAAETWIIPCGGGRGGVAVGGGGWWQDYRPALCGPISIISRHATTQNPSPSLRPWIKVTHAPRRNARVRVTNKLKSFLT